MKNKIVEVKDFHLQLGNKKIVTNLNFDVYAGELFAFLGANGSGKTSTIRSMLGIYPISSGTIYIAGQPYSVDMSEKVGYLPEERGLYVRSKVLDTMMYFGELKGMTREAAKTYSLSYLDRVGLADKASTKIKKLSGGQQQKVQLGVAMMNHPRLLILDEPTKGLDPVNRKLLMTLVSEHRATGAAVIYITHLMEEVERLAERLLIIKDGKQKAYGSIKEVKKTFGKNTIEEVFVTIYEESESTNE